MIALEQAIAMFEELLENSPEKYTVQKIWEIQFDDPLYVMVVRDKNGKQVFPGEVFPSIQKKMEPSLILISLAQHKSTMQ